MGEVEFFSFDEKIETFFHTINERRRLVGLPKQLIRVHSKILVRD